MQDKKRHPGVMAMQLLLMMLLMTRMLADVVSFCRGGYLACPVPPTWAIHDEAGWELGRRKNMIISETAPVLSFII